MGKQANDPQTQSEESDPGDALDAQRVQKHVDQSGTWHRDSLLPVLHRGFGRRMRWAL